MTVTNQINILNKKFKQNEALYDLDRKAAKISALSSNNLDKYEYLTGEDLNYKPSIVEPARFEYSPLGWIFNKELKEEDTKERLLERIKNIEGKKKEKLDEIKYKEKDNQIWLMKNEKRKEPRKLVLLKDRLDYIFTNFR